MKNKLKSSVLFICLVIILSGCSKSETKSVNGSFGFGEDNILNKSVNSDISINNPNKFSIDESNKAAHNILKSEEDIKQEEILEELYESSI